MAEYISREELIKALETDYNSSWCSKPQGSEEDVEGVRYDEGVRDEYDDVLKITCAMAAADVQLVKHGYWEEVSDYGGWGDTHYRCSVCSEEWYLEDGKPKDNNMNFCPRCGARMDGEKT